MLILFDHLKAKITKNTQVTKKLKKNTPWYIYFDICFLEPLILSNYYSKEIFSEFLQILQK